MEPSCIALNFIERGFSIGEGGSHLELCYEAAQLLGYGSQHIED